MIADHVHSPTSSKPRSSVANDPTADLSASQPDFPSTFTDPARSKMNILGSQSQGDTQPISQWAVDEFTNHRARELQAAARLSSNGTSTGGDSTSHTYLPGQTGHIDLLGVFDNPTPQDDDEEFADETVEDDHAAISQPQDVRAELYPESERFRPPRTPASRNKKRKREMDLTPQEQSTPSLPLNPFAGQSNGIEGLMDPSQLFKATQAPSSPFVPILPSDGLSDRPSPNLYDLQRPSTADGLSSPVKHPRSSMTRSVTEPQTTYVSMKESQEEREKRIKALKEKEEAADDSDDSFDSDDSMLRQRKFQRQLDLQSKSIFHGISAPSRPSSSVRSRGRGRGRGRGSGLSHVDFRTRSGLVPLNASKPEPLLLSDDPPPEVLSVSSEDETEFEEDAIQVDVSEPEDVADENKENVDCRGVQVPRTTSRSKAKRGRIRETPSSPSKQRDRLRSGSKEASPHGTGSTEKKDIPRQPPAFDVADSQTSTKESPVLRLSNSLSTQPWVPASSLDERCILQSQLPPDNRSSPSQNDERAVEDGAPRRLVEACSPHSKSLSKPPGVGHLDRDENVMAPFPRINDEERLQRPNNGDLISDADRQLRVNQRTKELQSQEASTGAEIPRSEEATVVAQGTATAIASSTIPESSAGTKSRKATNIEIDSNSTTARSPATGSYEAGFDQDEGLPVSRSTIFETAHSHITTSSGRSIVLRKAQQQHMSPTRQSSRLRTIAEIAAQPTPSDAVGTIDVDIDLLTTDDIEFHSVVSGSSPVAPVRKRRRGVNGLPIHLSGQNEVAMSSSPLSSPPHTQAASEGQASSTPITERTEPAQDSVEKVKGSDRRPCQQDPQSSIEPALRSPKATRRTPGKPTAIVVSNARQQGEEEIGAGYESAERSRRSSQRGQPDARATSEAKVVASEDPHTIIAPARVFAHFNGSCSGYYPATCIGVLPEDEPRYRVRFDDGTVGTVAAYNLKRLELRQGDSVKIDLSGMRTKTYVVDKLQDRRQPTITPDLETPSRRGSRHQDQNLLDSATDIRGLTSAVVSLKQRQSFGGGEDGPQTVVPLQYIYLTSTMWNNFKDRPFQYNNEALSLAPGLPTPSDRPSTPATPSSRTRRAKTVGASTFRPTMSTSIQTAGLFDSMVFAITNISSDDKRARIKQLIHEHNGQVIESGFDELFEIPKLTVTSGKSSPTKSHNTSFQLTSKAGTMGFTCLLADKHCRSAKYIQALALGIPCLSSRWIQDCATKQRILAWEPYLLAAGESTLLDGAIRSRQLQPYRAEDSKLSSVIEHRTKLLEGMSVLLIMTKSEEKAMKNHPLLTHALGAEKVARAASIEAAANTVADARANGERWDWVYSHENEKQTEKILYGNTSIGKKRKRGRVEDADPVKRPKIVGHEFVIQSLILGRLVDDDEA